MAVGIMSSTDLKLIASLSIARGWGGTVYKILYPLKERSEVTEKIIGMYIKSDRGKLAMKTVL